jgi:hypothetical protein
VAAEIVEVKQDIQRTEQDINCKNIQERLDNYLSWIFLMSCSVL